MSSITLSRRVGSGYNVWRIGLLVLNVATIIAMAFLMWASLLYAKPALNLAGTEQIAQRIFYLHMGCNIGALVGFLMSFAASIVYLFIRDLDWDRVAQASVEVGTVCGLGTIITGIFWARPTWNTFWTWDPRLTTATITVLLYIAYLLFRNGIDNRRTRALFGSIYALFAFLSVPLTYFSARWLRSIHPVIFGSTNPEAQGGFSLGATMGETLLIGTIAFCLLFSSLMIARWRQLRLEDRVLELREEFD